MRAPEHKINVINDRPSIDEYMMGLAEHAAKRTTCLRRGVGCVLTSKKNQVLAIAYNGNAAGLDHCNQAVWAADEKAGYQVLSLNPLVEKPIKMVKKYPLACEHALEPEGRLSCEAVHAEQNALMQCTAISSVHTAYVTRSPCKSCLKLLLNTSCQRIVFANEHSDQTPKLLWEKTGRVWEQFCARAIV